MANWNDRRMRIAGGLALAVLTTALFCGCGRSGPERAVVSGTVTYQGRPLPRGTIRFLPTAGTKTPMSGALIVDGEYSADKRGGVPIGTHKVVIEAFRPKGRPADPDAPAAGGLVPREQFLPAIFNTQSELRITLEPGVGSVKRDFELTN